MFPAVKKSVVYVEDDPDLISLVTLILGRKGYAVTGVTEGMKGFSIIREQRPDLILLDLMMPDLDGWELFKQLEANQLTMQIPVVVITAKTQPVDQILGLYVARADGYICKPFQPEELLDTIERLLRSGKQASN